MLLARGSSSTARICCFLALLLALLATSAFGDPFTVKSTNARNLRQDGRIVVNKGESLPMYSVATNSEEPGIIEGLRTLGEWMKMAGVLSDELPFVSASLPPTEVFEADIAGDSPHWDLYSTLRRDEPAPQAPSATPTGPPPSLVCSRRGVLVNKTGLVVRIPSAFSNQFRSQTPYFSMLGNEIGLKQIADSNSTLCVPPG